VVLAAAGLTFVLTAVLFVKIPKGFFPEEDIGQIQVNAKARRTSRSTRCPIACAMPPNVSARIRP
jgi:multidrug efflux pump subunit AcrB